MAQFFHPAREDISLTAVLAALGEPARMGIIRKLWGSETGQNCGSAAPCQDMPRSTLSSHMRILREAGIIVTARDGKHVECSVADDFRKRLSRDQNVLDLGCCTFRFD